MYKQIVCLVTLLAMLQLASAQFSSGRPTLPALLAIVRYTNTPCQGEQQDSGTCLADAECSRRAGQSVGPCANGFGTCCSFKVSSLTPTKIAVENQTFYLMKANPFHSPVYLRRKNEPKWDHFRESRLPKGRQWYRHLSGNHWKDTRCLPTQIRLWGLYIGSARREWSLYNWLVHGENHSWWEIANPLWWELRSTQ